MDTVKSVTARQIFDSRGNPTVEDQSFVVSNDKQKDDEKEEGIKKIVASNDSCVIEKEAEIANNFVVSSDDEKKKEIDLGISLDKLSLGPKKILLVLPLGGFLVHRVHCDNPNTIPKKRRPDFSSGNFMIYKRPYCEGFLKFCFERFEVGLWSSAMEHNIDGVLTNLIGELKSKLLFTWDQNHCTDSGYMCLDNKKKPLFMKELKNLWNKKWREGEYSSFNTLLIAHPVKAILNPPNTSIYLGVYDPENRLDDFLGPKGELRAFLDGLAEAKDVQTYVKDHPIGEPAITPSHSDWDYYSKIIRAFEKK